jgi:hypothetical protein
MSTPKKPESIPLDVAIREAHDWCQSAVFQGARLAELLDNQVAFDHHHAMAAEWRALKAANVLPGGVRVEVVECFFFLTALRSLLVALTHFTRHGNKPGKELAGAMKEFVAAMPKPLELRRILDAEYAISGSDVPELNVKVSTGLPLKAARGKEYKMAGDVTLEAAMQALKKLAPVLAAAHSDANGAA